MGEIKEVGKPDEECVGVYVTMIKRERTKITNYDTDKKCRNNRKDKKKPTVNMTTRRIGERGSETTTETTHVNM